MADSPDAIGPDDPHFEGPFERVEHLLNADHTDWNRPLVDPDDRLWRHPSELNHLNSEFQTTTQDPGRSRLVRHGSWALLGAAAVVLVSGLWWVGTTAIVPTGTNRTIAGASGVVASTVALSVSSVRPLTQRPLVVTPQSGVHLGIGGTDSTYGPIVMDVTLFSAADLAGINPGDVMVAIDGHAVDTMADVVHRLKAADPHRPMVIKIERDGQAVELPISQPLGADRYENGTTRVPAPGSP